MYQMVHPSLYTAGAIPLRYRHIFLLNISFLVGWHYICSVNASCHVTPFHTGVWLLSLIGLYSSLREQINKSVKPTRQR